MGSETSSFSGSFQRYDGGESNFVYTATTTSGEGTLYLANSTSRDLNFNVAYLERLGTTELPASGAAEFTEHAAIYVFFLEEEPGEGILAGHVASEAEGQVTFNVDFTQATISGSVYDLTFFGSDVSGLGSRAITFAETSIVDGGFSGATVAGGVNAAGTYDGLFVGPNGEELIGTYYHENTGGTLGTRGIFIAEAPTP